MSYRIAFGGAARSGKDLAADHLLSQYPGERIKFADLLHDSLRPMFARLGLVYENDRELLQYIGMWARGRDPNIFTRRILDLVRADVVPTYLLTDLRFSNEAEHLKSQDFVLVKVVRRDLPEPDADWRGHPSETGLNTFTAWDYVLKNCGTKEHYTQNVDALWRLIAAGEHKKRNFQTLTIE